MKPSVDLHIHTSYSSDGDHPPEEILSRANGLGLSAIAICDHDAVEGSRIAVSCCQRYSVEVIPSVEITTVLSGRELHVLAYYVDTTAPKLLDRLSAIRCQAESRMRKQTAALQDLGVDITYEEATALSPHAVPTCSVLVKAALHNGRNLNAPVFQEYTIGSRRDQPYHNFFLDHMRPGGDAYIEKEGGYDTIDAIQLISQNGGVPVIAHAAGSLSFPRDTDILDLLTARGLAGIEVYSSYHSEAMESFLLHYAGCHDLVVTAGSDFHGLTIKPNIMMGQLRYSPYEIVENLRARAAELQTGGGYAVDSGRLRTKPMSAPHSAAGKRPKPASGLVKAAIVGFGAVAKNAHLPWYGQRPDVELVAVVEPTAAGRALAQSLMPGVLLFDDVVALLQSVDVTFLDIASPPTAHAEAVLMAAKAGIATFCEKPFVTDWHSFQQIEKARLHGAPVIACCHNWYFAPAIRRALALIESGQLGQVHSIYFETRRRQPAAGAQHWKPEWRKTSSNGGGIIADLGYHGMYLASRMFRSRPLAAKTDALVSDHICDGAELSATVQLEYGMNRRAELHLSWTDTVRRTKVVVTGSKACVSIEDNTLRLYDSTKVMTTETFESVTADSWHAGWTAESLNHFMKAFHESDGGSCWSDIRWSMSALSAAYASAKSGLVETTFTPS